MLRPGHTALAGGLKNGHEWWEKGRKRRAAVPCKTPEASAPCASAPMAADRTASPMAEARPYGHKPLGRARVYITRNTDMRKWRKLQNSKKN